MTSRVGFTLIEGLLAIALMGVISGVSIPALRNYQQVSNVELAQDQIVQAINRAQFLSRLGEEDSPWGYSVEEGVVFKGESYATRDPAFDEDYPVENSVEHSGVTEVSFAKGTGNSSLTGSIALQLGNQLRVVHVGTEVGVLKGEGEPIGICHIPPGNPDNAHTLSIPDSAWPAHMAHGDTIGPCPGDEDDGNTGGAGDTGDTGGTGGGGSPDFDIETDGGVTVHDVFTPQITVIGAAITKGGLYDMPVTCKARIGTDNVEPYGDYNQAVDANVNDGEQHAYTASHTYTTETEITLTCASWEKKKWWYSGISNAHWQKYLEVAAGSSDNVIVLRDGDPVPDIEGFQDQESVEDFLQPYITDGFINIADNQVIYLFELGTVVQNSAYDSQDAVIIMTIGTN